jgi:hypothetical protein
LLSALFNIKTTLIGLVLLALLLLLPQFLPRFYIYLFAMMFAIALLATSLNLVLGFGGMYQFHHAVFYGFGAYAFALFVTKSGLPLWIGYVIAPFCSAALGLVLGLITVRLNRLYFGMLQISLGSLVWAITYRWYSFTGGDDGIHGIPLPDLVGSSTGAYYFNLIVAASCLLLMYTIVNSPFGRIFQGIRDNPERCQAVGVNVQKQLLRPGPGRFFRGGGRYALRDRRRVRVPGPDVLDPLPGDPDHVPAGRLVYLSGPCAGRCHHHQPENVCRHLHGILDPDSGHRFNAAHLSSCPKVFWACFCIKPVRLQEGRGRCCMSNP